MRDDADGLEAIKGAEGRGTKWNEWTGRRLK